MMGLFDRWAASGAFTYSDLAIYRIVYSVLVLISLPQISFVSSFPDSLYAPAPGPFRLLSGVPPQPILFTIQVLLALSLACLVVGLHTRLASLATGVLFLVSFGFLYSFGKVDHAILVAVVPLVLCGSGWGERLSLDSLRRNGHGASPVSPPQWPLRLLALLIGLAFSTAALAKYRSGWLDTSTQSAQGHFLKKYVAEGRTDGLAPLLADLHSRAAWELIDWLTVAIEIGMLVAVVTWPTFRAMLAVACVFHLSILLTLGIAFSSNVIAYGAFVGWAGLVSPVLRAIGRGQPRTLSPYAIYALIPVLTAIGLYLQAASSPHANHLVAESMVGIGAMFGVVYLLVASGRAARRLRPT